MYSGYEMVYRFLLCWYNKLAIVSTLEQQFEFEFYIPSGVFYHLFVCCVYCVIVQWKYLVLLQLSSLRFLSQYFRIIVSYIYCNNSCACGTIYLRGTFALRFTSLLKFQQSASFVTCRRLPRTMFSATLGEQRLHEILPQLPLKCRRWFGAVLMRSALTYEKR